MATDTIVLLEHLRCLDLVRTEAQTEPYIWPALIRVDDNTLATPGLLSIFTPSLGNARVVIKDSMRAGEKAPIPASVGVLRARFEDKLTVRRLVLVVALLEMDETPDSAMEAGFKAFTNELAAAIAQNLLALDAASEEEEKRIIEDIKKRVEGRVRSAVEGGLSSFEKAKVLAKLLNLDDPIGSAFISFRPQGPVADPTVFSRSLVDLENFKPTRFTLSFESRGQVAGVFESLSRYEIEGQLQVRPVVVDRCQSHVDAVNAAQEIVDGVEDAIKNTQDELQQASPIEKPFLISEIKRLRTEELPDAVAALEDARRALETCRSFRSPVADPGRIVVDGDRVATRVQAGNGHGHLSRVGSDDAPQASLSRR